MRAAPKHRNAHAFKLANHQLWDMAADRGVGKAFELVVGNGDALHGAGQVPQSGPEDQAKPHGRVACNFADLLRQFLSVP